jgi:hypothetical protein
MKQERDNMKEMFDSFNGQWDTEEPILGHQQRFLDRLDGKKKKNKWFPLFIIMPAVAAALVLMGVLLIYKPGTTTTIKPEHTVAKVSPKTQETQMYFASIIQKELAKVEKENSPETKKLVQDALVRMQNLESDYNKLTQELAHKGENPKIIHAMITNLQTRISFLQEVLTRIENIKKIKQNYHEDHSA